MSDTKRWQTQRIYSNPPDWFTALDEDLRAVVSPFLWIEELRTGRMVLREHDMWRAMKDLATTVQAQRDVIVQMRGGDA